LKRRAEKKRLTFARRKMYNRGYGEDGARP